MKILNTKGMDDEDKKILKNGIKSDFKYLEVMIIHSNQRWQYQMQNCKKKLNDKRIKQSTSRKGNCLDSSPIIYF